MMSKIRVDTVNGKKEIPDEKYKTVRAIKDLKKGFYYLWISRNYLESAIATGEIIKIVEINKTRIKAMKYFSKGYLKGKTKIWANGKEIMGMDFQSIGVSPYRENEGYIVENTGIIPLDTTDFEIAVEEAKKITQEIGILLS